MTTKPRPTVAYPRLTQLPDPPPVFDGMRQHEHIARADQVLRSHYRDDPYTLISGDGYLCFEARDARTSPHPDCLVAFGLPFPAELIEHANGYVINEVGQPPDFVLEIASPSTGVRDYTTKRDQYATRRVKEYWRFDPSGGEWHDAPLAGDTLADGTYRAIPVTRGADGIYRGYSEVLGLELHWDAGELRFWNPATGEYLLDLVEALDALVAAEDQVAQSETRANNAETRANDAESRAREAESRASNADSRASDAENRASEADSRANEAELQAAELRAEMQRLREQLRRRQSPD